MISSFWTIELVYILFPPLFNSWSLRYSSPLLALYRSKALKFPSLFSGSLRYICPLSRWPLKEICYPPQNLILCIMGTSFFRFSTTLIFLWVLIWFITLSVLLFTMDLMLSTVITACWWFVKFWCWLNNSLAFFKLAKGLITKHLVRSFSNKFRMRKYYTIFTKRS